MNNGKLKDSAYYEKFLNKPSDQDNNKLKSGAYYAKLKADQDTAAYYQKRQIPIVQTSNGVRDYGAHLTPEQKEKEQKEWLRFLFTWDNTPTKKKDKQPSKELSAKAQAKLEPKESAILKFLHNKSYTDFLEIAMGCGGLHAEKTRVLCDRLVSEKKLIQSDLDERMYKWNN
jgi:hypothetical protein